MRALACLALVLALGLGAGDLRRAKVRVTTPRAPSAMRRIAARYDRSRAGRRLATRLWAAQLHVSPVAWRAAQLMLTAPVASIALACGAAPMTAILTAMSVTRTGGALLLRFRRGAASSALDEGAPQLARALATELAAWGSGTQTLATAAARCEGRVSPAVARVLQAAAARVILGGDAATALRRAVHDAAPGLPAHSPAARVAAVFALHRHDAAATALALERMASSLEDDAAARHDARAATSEVRMSAVAVPVIAAATLVMLLATDEAAQIAALSMPLLPMLGVAAVIVVLASVGARRMVAV